MTKHLLSVLVPRDVQHCHILTRLIKLIGNKIQRVNLIQVHCMHLCKYYNGPPKYLKIQTHTNHDLGISHLNIKRNKGIFHLNHQLIRDNSKIWKWHKYLTRQFPFKQLKGILTVIKDWAYWHVQSCEWISKSYGVK